MCLHSVWVSYTRSVRCCLVRPPFTFNKGHSNLCQHTDFVNEITADGQSGNERQAFLPIMGLCAIKMILLYSLLD